MDFRFDKKSSFDIVGFAIDTTVQTCSKETPQLWMRFLEIWDAIPHRIKGTCYGLSVTTSIDGCSFKYVVGVAVSSKEDVPEGMSVHEVAAADYVVFTHKGPIRYVGKTYEQMYTSGMKETGKEQDTKLWLEVYADDYTPESADATMEIWVPIKK